MHCFMYSVLDPAYMREQYIAPHSCFAQNISRQNQMK